MNYCIFLLKFKTALHIGYDYGGSSLVSAEMQIHSDTFFSALCHVALSRGGQDSLNALVSWMKSGKINISDAFPYSGEELYLPKPCLLMYSNRIYDNSTETKKYKKMKYLPASGFQAYINYIKGKGEFDIKYNSNISFGIRSERTLVSIRGNDETTPFDVGTFTFHVNCGLYIIMSYDSTEQFEMMNDLFNLMSYSGIGGKCSSGLGTFTIDRVFHFEDRSTESIKCLSQFLTDNNADVHMLLNVALPHEEEMEYCLDSALYQIIRRGGFVQSQNYSAKPLKKRVMYFMGPGSCFKHRFQGDVYDVSVHGAHAVYRAAKPMFMGVRV